MDEIVIDKHGFCKDVIVRDREGTPGVLRTFDAVIGARVKDCNITMETEHGTILTRKFGDVKVIGAPDPRLMAILNNRPLFRRLTIRDDNHPEQARKLRTTAVSKLMALFGMEPPKPPGVLSDDRPSESAPKEGK